MSVQEKQELKAQEREVKKKNTRDFWMEFTEFFRSWLHELTRKYKERGEFPVMACWLLPSYYTDDKDIEIAAFASLLIRDSERQQEYIRGFREMFNDKPWQWFRSRGFVNLGMGRLRDERTGGVNNGKVAEYFGMLYDYWRVREDNLSRMMTDFFGEERGLIKERLLRLVLGASDGFSLGLRSVAPPDLKCPPTDDVRAFLREFVPEYGVRGRGGGLFSFDEAVSLFGFERDCDFFYAVLAYKELQRRNPKGCSRLATVFQKRYRDGNILPASYWLPDKKDGILLEIEL